MLQDTPTTMLLTDETERREPPTFAFADPHLTTLVWDAEDKAGFITKHSIGDLPLQHAEKVIRMLMKTLEDTVHENKKRKRRGTIRGT
jgi:hypothetical protein